MDRDQMIHSLSNTILDHRLAKFPDIKLWLRQRNDHRFVTGRWFQGNNYIFVGLVKRGDALHVTQQVGIVFDFKKEQKVRIYSAIVFRSEQDKKYIKCYNDIVKLDGFMKIRDNLYHKYYDDGGIDTSSFEKVVEKSKEVLDWFLGQQGDWLKISECMRRHNVEEELRITDENFNRRLAAVEVTRRLLAKTST
jgi:hypothetical protein